MLPSLYFPDCIFSFSTITYIFTAHGVCWRYKTFRTIFLSLYNKRRNGGHLTSLLTTILSVWPAKKCKGGESEMIGGECFTGFGGGGNWGTLMDPPSEDQGSGWTEQDNWIDFKGKRN